MPGVRIELAEYSLNIKLDAKPVKQPSRRFADEHQLATGKEIAQLTTTGFIKEVKHPGWVDNPILVPKKIGALRMCIDYTNLNKA
jgi:hypothetical protein